jgi:uncharacterized membrane protein
MLVELTPASAWLKRHQYISRLWRAVSWVLAAIAYCGVLVAPTVTLGIPFQVLRWLKIQPPSVLYWLTATAILLFTLCGLYLFGRAGYHWLRKGIFYLEAVFGLVGVVLAVAFIIWIMPTGSIPTRSN